MAGRLHRVCLLATKWRSILILVISGTLLVCYYLLTWDISQDYPQKMFAPATSTATAATQANKAVRSTANLGNHIFFISAVYYETSKMYAERHPPNTVQLLYNSLVSSNLNGELYCVSSRRSSDAGGGDTDRAKELVSKASVTYAFEPLPSERCKMTAYIALCPVLERSDELSLLHTVAPLQNVSVDGLPVALCMAPMFFFESWQTLITSVEVHQHFGVQLHILYIMSATKPVIDIVQWYKERGKVSMELWPPFDNTQSIYGFVPNYELEWRNQATAYTDCLMKYREAAEFIIMQDMDDLFVPRLGATYLEEFRTLTRMYPNAASFTYTRFSVEYTKYESFESFSLERLINESRTTKYIEGGKTVVRPDRVSSFHIHKPGRFANGTELVTLPLDTNRMYHIQYAINDHIPYIYPLNVSTNGTWHLREQIAPTHLRALDDKLAAMRAADNSTTSPFTLLLAEEKYALDIYQCYRLDVAYSSKCPTQVKCSVPKRPGLKCGMAAANYTNYKLAPEISIYVNYAPVSLSMVENGCSFFL